jgi:hypothetical protein
MSASYFSANYQEARTRFLAAVEKSGGRLSQYINPNRGPGGEELATDVAEFGPADATQVLYGMSATHGAEGFCGSGCQTGMMESGFTKSLPDNVRLVLIHAIKPFGFAWLRRVTEENVDLNRNFVDHPAADYPVNEGYEALHSAIFPDKWTEQSLIDANAQPIAYLKTHGPEALQAAASAGQYSHADGVYFGGNASTWARNTFEKILADTLGNAERTVLIDFHTGLGEYGYGELISEDATDSEPWQWARDWFGESVKSTNSGKAFPRT